MMYSWSDLVSVLYVVYREKRPGGRMDAVMLRLVRDLCSGLYLLIANWLLGFRKVGLTHL